MQTPDLILLYVKDIEKSTRFYRDLLTRDPKAGFPTYVAFGLDGGITLALWSTKAPNMPSAGSGNRFELAFQVENEETVESMCSEWRQRGMEIEQEPFTAVFGRTFVGLDPDGHRIRVCVADR
jgi:catechol 2,3-dioxygenase-like lactoylglutathione lyase family enzyme